MAKHLMFYDGECGLCDHAVQLLLRIDKQQKFIFAPLKGLTAATILKDLPAELKGADSLILVQNYLEVNQKFYILGQGVLRICWLLGGWWQLLGWISFLPGFLYNWIYRLVARNRHRFFTTQCILPDLEQKERFLP